MFFELENGPKTRGSKALRGLVARFRLGMAAAVPTYGGGTTAGLGGGRRGPKDT